MFNNEFYEVDRTNKAKRLPICFLVDNSQSMDVVVEGEEFCTVKEVNLFRDQRTYKVLVPNIEGDPRIKTRSNLIETGLENFYSSVENDDIAADSCEYSIVTFNNTPSLLEGFGSVFDKKIPFLDNFEGDTNLSDAIHYALNVLSERKKAYERSGIGYMKPWLVIFTDGDFTDDITAVTDEIMTMQKQKELAVYVVYLTKERDVRDSLKGLSRSKPVCATDAASIQKFINFLVDSVSNSSSSGALPPVLQDDDDIAKRFFNGI